MFLAAKEEEERDKVPEIWNYTVKREFRLPDTDEESLEETEEIFSIHAEDEVSPKFETDNNGNIKRFILIHYFFRNGH